MFKSTHNSTETRTVKPEQLLTDEIKSLWKLINILSLSSETKQSQGETKNKLVSKRTHKTLIVKQKPKSSRKHADAVVSEQRASRPQWKEEANAVSLDSFGPKRSSSWLTVVGPVMAYQLYRNTTLGNSLQESLDELIQVSEAAQLSSIATVLLLLRCLLAPARAASLCFAGCGSLQPRSVPDKCSTHLCVQHLNHLTSNSSVA